MCGRTCIFCFQSRVTDVRIALSHNQAEFKCAVTHKMLMDGSRSLRCGQLALALSILFVALAPPGVFDPVQLYASL